MLAVSDDETVLTASASSQATPGTYEVEVIALAKAQVNSFATSSSTTNLGTNGSLQIDIGGNSHFINVNDPTLDSIATAINDYDDQFEIGVRAEVIDTQNPDPTKRYEIVVRATETGAANGFTIAVDDGTAEFSDVINGIEANNVVPAGDAQLSVNGVTAYRATNTISDLFTGITLDLNSESEPETTVTVTVSPDAQETGDKVQGLVDAYNQLVDFFSAQARSTRKATRKARCLATPRCARFARPFGSHSERQSKRLATSPTSCCRRSASRPTPRAA